ncbi:MAG TPA: hypothetical protein VNC11_16705 [Gemmatimonadaceae bacterium]|nr:hypothetical protein [Gemmatimonadaceae bacterium]
MRVRLTPKLILLTLLASGWLLTPSSSRGQVNVGGRNEVFAGSDLESYLRYLQILGKSNAYPWSMRAFSPWEIDQLAPTDTNHPWAARYDLQRRTHPRLEWSYVRPTVGVYVNSNFPYGGNDGAVWQGRGLTSSFQGGISARWGHFSGILAPVAFRSENQSFPLMQNGETGRLAFADGQLPTYIDRPQRFGLDPYSQLDWGQSELRFDGFGVTAGVSTANMWWGPTNSFPYILGNNAAGFKHIFFGTQHPANIWIGTLHGRLIYGQLDQSEFSPITGPKYFVSFEEPGKLRFMAGVVASFQPRGMNGFEIGGSRFFHGPTDQLGYWFSVHDLFLPLQDLYKKNLPIESDTLIFGGSQALKENQLASLFVRWAPVGSGFEVYGEYGREDHALDKRDIILEPDHSSSMDIGFRHAWGGGSVIKAIRGEAFSIEANGGTRTRGEGQTYVHGVLRQGHTERGQMLGADVGPGSGSAQEFAFDRYTDRGRFSAFVRRQVQHEERFPIIYRRGPALEKAVDVMNSLGAEMSRFIGPFDVLGRMVFTTDMNRYFRADQGNLNFALQIRQNF